MFLLRSFELLSHFAVRDLVQVKVLRCDLEEPLWLDGHYCPHVSSVSEHEICVDNPFRLVVKDTTRMKSHYLFVLQSHVAACPIQHRSLHEKATQHALLKPGQVLGVGFRH